MAFLLKGLSSATTTVSGLIDSVSPVNWFLFPAPPPSYNLTKYKEGELVWIPSRFWKNRSTACLVLPWPYGAKHVMVYCHANAEDIGYSRPFLQMVQRIVKVHIMAVEYPGYGVSPGKPFEQSVNAAIEDVHEFITKELGFAEEEIIWFGRSIGTGPSTRICSKRPAAGLVLMSPYSSINSVIKHLLGTAFGYMLPNRFENKKKIVKVKCPSLFIHGSKDSLIPPSHSEKLFERSPAKVKELKIIQGTDHNDFHPDAVGRPILAFLERLAVELPHTGTGPARPLEVDRRFWAPPPDVLKEINKAEEKREEKRAAAQAAAAQKAGQAQAQAQQQRARAAAAAAAAQPPQQRPSPSPSPSPGGARPPSSSPPSSQPPSRSPSIAAPASSASSAPSATSSASASPRGYVPYRADSAAERFSALSLSPEDAEEEQKRDYASRLWSGTLNLHDPRSREFAASLFKQSVGAPGAGAATAPDSSRRSSFDG
eukprot:tig00000411_g574.t1